MIQKLTHQDIDEVAQLHKQELSGFLSELGVGFLKKFYRATLSIPEIYTLVEVKNEQILGFASCALNVKGLYRKILFADLLSFIISILNYFITHPNKIVKTMKILSYPGFKANGPELLTIAIIKNARGRGIGEKLFNNLIKIFKKNKITKFKISVYKKLSANNFYRKMGCKLISTFFYLEGPMNYYEYQI